METVKSYIEVGLHSLLKGRMTPHKYALLCKGIKAKKEISELELLDKIEEHQKFNDMFDKCYSIKEFAKTLVYNYNNKDIEYARSRRSNYPLRNYDRDDYYEYDTEYAIRDNNRNREYAVDRRLRENRIYRDDRRRYDRMDYYTHHLPMESDYVIGDNTRYFDKMENIPHEKILHEIEQYLQMNAHSIYEALKQYPKEQWISYLKNNQPHIFEIFKDKIYR